MTEKITKWKRFELSSMHKIFFLLMGSFLMNLTATADRDLPQLPLIKNVGIVPVQLNFESSGSPSYMVAGEIISHQFTNAARKTKKFRFINDDLIKMLWKTAEGRKELKEKFELDAFLLLTLKSDQDRVELSARLTDGDLSNILVESEALSIGWLNASGETEIKERVNSIVYRLLNRFPADLFVTSIHGSYLTLSGGRSLGLASGDTIDIESYFVSTTHPANGSFLEFKVVKKGTAKIVNVKPSSSLAKITDLIHQDAISIGDGARSVHSVARNYFKNDADKKTLHDHGRNDIIVEARPSTSKEKVEKEKNPANLPQQELVRHPPSNKTVTQATDKPTIDTTSLPKGSQVISGESSKSKIDHYASKFIDLAYVQTGYKSTSITGTLSESSKFPLWVINYIGAYGHKKFWNDYTFELGGSLNFGPSANGGIWGVDTYGKAYFEATAADLGDFIAKYRYGVDGGLYSIGFTDSSFGGYDFMKIGGFGGIAGDYFLPEYGKLEWFGEFALYPIAIGQVGISGTKYAVNSSFGYEFRTGGVFLGQKNAFEYGGYIGYGSQTTTLANSSQINIGQTSLNALMRYRF